RERLDAVERSFETNLHRHQPERVAGSLGDGRAGPVRAVEGPAQVLVELGAIGRNAGADLVKRLDRKTAGIGVSLEHQRRYRTEEHCLRHALGAVATDVAGHLAASSGVS